MPEQPDRPADVFQRDVCGWYPTARESILFYETQEGVKAIEAITEIRDALDDFWAACVEEDDQAVVVHLTNARDHLRSAAVEPLERAVEQRFAIANKKRDRTTRRRDRILRRTLLLSQPDREKANGLESLIKENFEHGRRLKSKLVTAPEAVAHFKQAHTHTKQLAELYDAQKVHDRAWDIIVGAVVGILLTALGIVVERAFF